MQTPEGPDIFDKVRIPPALDEYLRSTNPWWEGKPGRVLPRYRRWAFQTLLKKLKSGLAPAVVLRGARQVGKTTLQEQTIQHLLHTEKVDPRHILRIQFDEIPALEELRQPLLDIVQWFQDRILKRTLNEAAHAGQPVFLFLDEAQNLHQWAPQLKALVDHHTVRVVVTGSSALRIEAGRDSLAGRITTLELGTLLLREVAELRWATAVQPALPDEGLEPLVNAEFWHRLVTDGSRVGEVRDRAFAAFSERGGYPIVHARPEAAWAEVADQLNETVVRRVIEHDLRLGERGRKRDANLLEEVFRLVCRYAGQAPGAAVYITDIGQALQANVGWQRILSYLKFLDGALLVKLIEPLEIRLKKRKGNKKICLIDLGLRASWLQEVVPLHSAGLQGAPHLADQAGHLAENVVGAFFAGLPHLDIAHFPERTTEPEVDFILTVGDKRIPVEVKYRQRIDPHRDTVGLRSFLEKTHYNAPLGVLVTMLDDVSVPDPRIIPVSLPSLLLMR
ncbi:MAG TPA: AAA family ATPase [Phycisphaerae bacterium]|nr:AAA family ATPase [Phycisphaerae bacterium]HNU46825.1 AAA family ATPase [Phycisphaerae bacterium]